jgi:hypothetical protein
LPRLGVPGDFGFDLQAFQLQLGGDLHLNGGRRSSQRCREAVQGEEKNACGAEPIVVIWP